MKLKRQGDRAELANGTGCPSTAREENSCDQDRGTDIPQRCNIRDSVRREICSTRAARSRLPSDAASTARTWRFSTAARGIISVAGAFALGAILGVTWGTNAAR